MCNVINTDQKALKMRRNVQYNFNSISPPSLSLLNMEFKMS